jgi:peptidoglycan/xylan/chitin deacetylase (PgdA/CDA1 family)
VGYEVITKRKRKWVLILVLVLLWGSGLFGFFHVENVIAVRASKVQYAAINPVIGVARDVTIPVLLYHGIVKQDDGENVTIANFKKQMQSLKDNGYTTLDSNDLYAYYRQGARLPDRSIVITFDDGRKDSYENGDPILGEFGFKAVMFVVTDKQDENDSFFLSWDELRQMHDSGRWDIEAHANNGHDTIQIDAAGNMGNYYSNEMWLPAQNRVETLDEYKARVYQDLQAAKSELEENIPGSQVLSMAFPLGDYGQKSINIDRNTAIKSFMDIVKTFFALSFELNFSGSDFNNFQDSDYSLLRRFEVPSDLSADDLIALLKDSRAAALPYAVSGFTDDELANWFCNWGKVYVEGNNVKLSSDENESGGEVILYGGHYWKNYSLDTSLSIQAGSAYMIGRYVDDNNFVFCQISGKDLILGEKIHGQNRTLLTQTISQKDNYPMRFDFMDNNVALKLDGQVLASATAIDPSLSQGGVGFQAWNPEGGPAMITVERVMVSQPSNDGHST